jgi:hypothetical protein
LFPLKVLVFPFSGEFSMNSHFSSTTSREYKTSLLLTIVQGRSFANGSSQNVLQTKVANILFTD